MLQVTTTKKFKTDLKRSEPFELWTEQRLKDLGWLTKRNNTATYDIRASRWQGSVFQEVYIECKFDELSEASGNYFIEAKSISNTQSDLLVIGVINNAYIIPMDTARMLFKDYPKVHGGDYIQNGGFYKENPGALVPKTIFEQSNFQKL